MFKEFSKRKKMRFIYQNVVKYILKIVESYTCAGAPENEIFFKNSRFICQMSSKMFLDIFGLENFVHHSKAFFL